MTAGSRLKGADLRALDVIDIAEARAHEDRAEHLLLAIGVQVEETRGNVRTRGPRQEAMRDAAKRRGAHEAREAFFAADTAYWRIILRHDGLAHKTARELRRYVPNLRDDHETIVQIVRIGWHRAALRFDPENGTTFAGYAFNYAKSELQRTNDRQSDVTPGETRMVRAQGGWTTLRGTPLDAPVGNDESASLHDLLADDRDIEDEVASADEIACLRAAIRRLPDRERDVLLARADGEKLDLIATRNGVSKAYISQIAANGLKQLEKLMHERKEPTPTAYDSPEHRAKINEGIARAKAAGVHTGRPPSLVPEAAILAVQAGEPLKVVARTHGVDPNTLRRRAVRIVTVRAEVADPWVDAGRLLTDAIKMRDRAKQAIATAEIQIAEAQTMMEKAREMLAAQADEP